MKLNRFFEFVESDFDPVKSFYIKDDLNPKVWEGFEINKEVRENLLKIAQDFYSSTDLNADVKDIILTGSLSNYNWSEKYSDYDLHILIDFNQVSEDVDLVKKYVDAAKNNWNKAHDIKVKGYEVEVYIQDTKEVHRSTGIFSLLKDKWVVKPSKIDFTPDDDAIIEKAKSSMMSIDDLETQVEEDKYDHFLEKVKKVWDKIKNYRKSGLESEGGEFSIGNLVFKLLRRNGYIEKMIELKRYSYDKQFESLDEDGVLKLLYYIDEIDKEFSNQSYEGWSVSINYDYDETKDYIDIHYNQSGYEEGGYEDMRVYYKQTPVLVEYKEEGSTVYGDYANENSFTINTIDELISAIKERYNA